MTVNYTADVANGSSFGCFWKILGRWKGSVYKLVWRELVAYLFLYFTINFSYRYGMNLEQRSVFEKVKVYCRTQIESIPMSFVLGFYVTLIVKRWWDQYWILPLPDSIALYISSSIHGQDERGRILRRTIMRYTVLAYIIMLQRISFRVKKRFPTLQHLVDSGLMMESEKKIFDKLNEKAKVNKFWIPIIWSTNLVNRARVEGRIHSDHMVQSILNELSEFRRRLGRVSVYDNISVPLVYTQVVTLAVYTYFTAALMGHQWVGPEDAKVLSTIYPGQELDLYFPIFLCLQFVFYIGWLKVAETLINPFGEDDDDFEINWLIDRHLQVSYLVVDEIHEEHPELLKDQYWDQVVPQQLPYNLASENFRRKEPLGSTASMKIKERETVYDHLNPKRHASMIPDEVYADYESVTDSPLVDGRKSWIQRQLSRVESFRSTSSASSLFNRNRAASGHHHHNGGLHLQGAGSHRPSLYEKLMHRRSSKEQINAIKFGYQNRGHDNKENTVPTIPVTQANRPRVPTPEVIIKETSLMPVDPKFMNTRVVNSAASPRQVSPASPHNAYGTSGLYHGRILPTVFGQNNNNLMPSIPSPRSKSPLSSLYDTNESVHIMLSPIEENDGSPYSTSSASRSVKSSNYPTTNTIFGRKPSPPPQDELPPIPTEHNTHSGNGMNRSDNTQMVNINGNQNLDKSAILSKMNTCGSLTHDGDEPYMTIAEISDIRNEAENNNSFAGMNNNNNNSSTNNFNRSSSDTGNNPRERKQSVMTRQNAVITEEEFHDNSLVNSNNTTEIDDQNDKEEIFITNEVLGNPTINNLNDVNNSNDGMNSRKVSDVSNSRKVSEISNTPSSYTHPNSRRTSEISNKNPNNNNNRKISQASNNSNSLANSRKTSEISNTSNSNANSRKVSEISNNGNSRKTSQISSGNETMNPRKISEMNNSNPNSRRISEISNNSTSNNNSRKVSEISNTGNSGGGGGGGNAFNSRKNSEMSANNFTVESGLGSISDFSRKTSESSTSSHSTINADQNNESDQFSNKSHSSTSLSSSSKDSDSNNTEEGINKNLFEVFV